jgi:hypothetical protein
MRPTVPEQLGGLARVLATSVAPHVTDAYVADVLEGVIVTLEMLGDSWSAVPAFLRDDAAATAAVLALVGIATADPPADPLDLDALRAHHCVVRGELEAAMPAVMDDPDARRAAVALFRDRADRYPLVARPTGGFRAHAAR